MYEQSLNELRLVAKGYSVDALKMAIAQSTLNAEQIKAILSAKGLTEAEIEEFIATNALSASQKGATASTLGLGTAFKGLGVKIKSATASMIAWMATNPIGWITAVVSAIGASIYGVVKLHDALTVSLEEQKEKLQETKEAYEGVKNELQEVESELQNTQNKIEELENIPNLTWVEQEELDRLREVTKELELQKKLKQDARLESAEDLYKENKATFDKEFKSSYGNTSVLDLKEQLSSGHIGTGQLDYGNITDVISALQYIREEKAKLTDESEIAEYDEFISDLADSIKSNGQEYLSSLSEYKQNILEIASIRDLTEDEQTFYDYLSSMQKMIYEFYSPATWNSLEFDSIFNTEGIEKTKEELIEMYKAGELSSAEMLESFPKLNQAIQESEIIAGESSDAFKEVFNEIAALAKERADVVNGFDSKSKLFDQLTTSTDSLDKFQSSVKSAADAYTTLLTGNYSSSELLDSIQAITKAASDMGESIDWESISTSGNPLQAIQDAIESVSKTYADSVLSGTGIDSDSKFGQMLANIIQEAYKSEAALSSLNIQVDSLQSAYSSLTDIIQTYNETGYITFDQLQTLLAMEPQYVACLIDENGQLKLNQESMLALANQRLNDAESQAIQQAMTELGTAAFQEEQTAVEDNAQAFSDAVDDLSTYNEGLAETIATANVATSEILKLNDAINGAESEGAKDDQIDSVLDNLNTKLKLIQNTRNNLKQNFNNFGKIVGKSSSDSSPSASSSTETTKEFSEELNWIEKLVNKVSSTLDKLKDKVSNTYIGWSVRNHSLSKAMEKTNEAINVQQQAYEKYMQKAASVGLSQKYVDKIQNGTLDIEGITDESLNEQIRTYTEW